MGDKSGINWTDATWNPVTGCDKVSPGCDHCYALTMAARLKGMGVANYTATVSARWACGGGTMNAVPVLLSDVLASCAHCVEAIHYPDGPCVYRCYDADGELLYIGSSIKLWQRIRAHRSGTRWFSEVARVVGEPHPTEAACRLAEALAIRNECPAYNVDNNTLEVEA